MDVSTAPHTQPDSNPNPSQPAHPLIHPQVSNDPVVPGVSTAALAPERRMRPLRYGLLMGLAAGLSVAMICAVVLAVAGVLAPGKGLLNYMTVVLSIVTAVYVGIRSWLNQKSPRPLSQGRCPDCGRELLSADDRCSLCGRTVTVGIAKGSEARSE